MIYYFVLYNVVKTCIHCKSFIIRFQEYLRLSLRGHVDHLRRNLWILHFRNHLYLPIPSDQVVHARNWTHGHWWDLVVLWRIPFKSTSFRLHRWALPLGLHLLSSFFKHQGLVRGSSRSLPRLWRPKDEGRVITEILSSQWLICSDVNLVVALR